ncbi:hypothetical protein [Aureivirga sp. CE67]|uniref:hypothetical protein n=1 Tax=Aureivirga sp. CE67 TaxID=1788983 RepID=UPI0018C9F688|nr:hypothetical protein [Aureivirga sp. CE67]
MKPDIEIICPKCLKKAAFFSASVIRWTMVVPDINGKVICGSCGLNKDHQFTPKDYYYSISVGKRFLYARTFENLKDLYVYFKEDKRLNGDPELDFPKTFYENRMVIVSKIEKLIDNEIKSC